VQAAADGRGVYVIRSAGAWGELDDIRTDAADRLGFALAIFGAEATLRCVARIGTVTLYDRDGREILSYEGERLSVLGGPYVAR
jgi:hypothetical protein